MGNELFVFDNRLDTEYLESIYEGDKEYAAVVFEQFILSYPEQLKEIEDNYASGNVALYKSSIHKIKATFSFVGLTILTNKAEVIEKNCTEHTDTNMLSHLHLDFIKTSAELISIVEAELVRLQA